jgi:predicted membrane channel-forming protein YqfA (hemolysin III family)
MFKIDPQYIVLLISSLAGLVGMPLIDAAKKFIGVSGKVALLLATCVSIVLALAVVAVNGALSGMELTLPALIEASGVVFSVATIFYKSITGEKNA